MSTDQEIIRIGKQLEKVVKSDSPNEDLALDLLRSLQDLPMTLDLLQRSHVGLSVNTLRKKCVGSDVASVGKKLIKQWKKLIQGPDPDNKTDSNPSTPPPVEYNPKNNIVTSNNNMTSSSSNENGGSHSQPTTPLSPIVPNFPPTIDSSRREASTGDSVRDRCRDMVYNAMKKGIVDVSIEDDTRLYNLSAAIEKYIFNEMKGTNNKYKNRIRSRISNLGDLKNPGLKQRVISGEISIETISTMSTEEMASDVMKKLRSDYIKESIRDSQMSVQEGTKTDLLKCSKCGKRNCTYNQMQTRSADEPMTTFVYCIECGNRWKFC